MAFLVSWTSYYKDLWKSIIRPPRKEYEIDDLGPTEFTLGDVTVKRTDMEIVNGRNLKLQCSWFRISGDNRARPVVVYLHGNASSRLEATEHLEMLLCYGITLFCFDFAGCGRSEGKYISLGYYESADVKLVVDFLRKQNTVSLIGLWGRSMGSVSALMHADRDPGLAAIVLDSPFCSLHDLAADLAHNKAKVPEFITGAVMNMVRSTIKDKAKFDINMLNPLKNHVGKSLSPAFFISAENDELIDPSHAKQLHDAYHGQKRYMLVKGTHNSVRESYVNDSISFFFYNCFGLDYLASQTQNHKEDYQDSDSTPLEVMSEDEILQIIMKKSMLEK